MKTIKITFCFFLLSISLIAQQEKDYSLAHVGKQVLGVHVFVGCEPANEYDYIATIDVRWHAGDPDKSFLEIIERAKKKYPNFNAIVFKNFKFETADIIKFRGLELSGGGFRVGDKAVYIDDGKPQYGEIIQLINTKQKVEFKYFDEYGEENTSTIDNKKISMISNEQYKEFIAQQKIEIEKHKFIVGKKVSYVSDKKPCYGEVISLNNKNHKASVKYLNIFGEEKISDIKYLELEKVSEEKFQIEVEKLQEEIAKYKFKVGEKVSWSKDAVFSNKSEITPAEIVALKDLDHKATIKYLNKDNLEKQENVSYLNLSKLK